MRMARSKVRLVERQIFGRQIVNGDQIGNYPGFLTHTRADRSREVWRKIHYIELEGLAFPLRDLCWRILRGKSVTVTAHFAKEKSETRLAFTIVLELAVENDSRLR